MRNSTSIKTIALSHLETDLEQTLNECAATGEPVVVEMPNQRLFVIQSLDPQEDDPLVEQLLVTNRKFQDLVAKSKASSRKLFGRAQPQPRDN